MGGPVEIAILGAGISGSALAFHLAERHIGPVAVYDPRTPSAGATGRAAGIVTEQLWDPWDVEVTRAAKAEYASLSARWDPDAYSVNGFVRWAEGRAAADALEQALRRQQAWGVDVRRIEPDRLRELVPWGRFSDTVVSGFSPTDSVVTPSALTAVYGQLARRAGVEFYLGEPFASVRRGPSGWEITTGSRVLSSRQIVVAAGAWSKRILESVQTPVPLVPYRTQAALLKPPTDPGPFPSLHDVDTDVYARPEGHGRVLAGDGTELIEVDPESYRSSADPAFVAHLGEVFHDRLPGWSEASVGSAWAGVCTATPDRRPLVGPVPGRDGIHCLAGFNGFGVMRAGEVARRLADLLASGGEGDRPQDRLAPVLPERFHGKAASFEPRPGFTLEAGDHPRC